MGKSKRGNRKGRTKKTYNEKGNLYSYFWLNLWFITSLVNKTLSHKTRISMISGKLRFGTIFLRFGSRAAIVFIINNGERETLSKNVEKISENEIMKINIKGNKVKLE